MSVWSRWRKSRDCFHHDHSTGESWIVGTLIDLGRRKLWSCTKCGRRWVS